MPVAFQKYLKFFGLLLAFLCTDLALGLPPKLLSTGVAATGPVSPKSAGTFVECAVQALGDVEASLSADDLHPHGFAQWLPLDAHSNRALIDLDRNARQRLAQEKSGAPSALGVATQPGLLFLIAANGLQKILNKHFDAAEVDEINRVYFSLVLEEVRRNSRLRSALVASSVPSAEATSRVGVLSAYSWTGVAFQGLSPEALHAELREVHQRVSRSFREIARLRQWEATDATSYAATPLAHYPDLWHYWGIGRTLDDATIAGRKRRHALNQDLTLHPVHSSAPSENIRPLSENRRIIGLATHERHGAEVLEDLHSSRQSYSELRQNQSLRELFTPDGQLQDGVVDAYREAQGENSTARAHSFLGLIYERFVSNSHDSTRRLISFADAERLLTALDNLNLISVNPLQTERRSVQHVRSVPGLRWIVSGDLVGAGRMNMQALIREFFLGPPLTDSSQVGLRSRAAFEATDVPMLRRAQNIATAMNSTLVGNRHRPLHLEWNGGVSGNYPLRIFEQTSPGHGGELLAVMDMSGDDVLIGVTREFTQEDWRRFTQRFSQGGQDRPGDFRLTIHPSISEFGAPITAGLESLEKSLRKILRKSGAFPPEVLSQIGITPRILRNEIDDLGAVENHTLDILITMPQEGSGFTPALRAQKIAQMRRLLTESIMNREIRNQLPSENMAFEFGNFVESQ